MPSLYCLDSPFTPAAYRTIIVCMLNPACLTLLDSGSFILRSLTLAQDNPAPPTARWVTAVIALVLTVATVALSLASSRRTHRD